MIDGNAVAIDPPLHLGVLAMIEGASDLADAAELLDDVAVGNHAPNVHIECTSVNMAYVQPLALRGDMAKEPSDPPPIAQLAARSGLKGNALALACGWKARNGPQPYLEGRPVTLDVAAKFARGIVGKGSPPITAKEVLETVEDRGILEFFWSLAPAANLNEDVLTTAFVTLLDTVGIAPYEDERARKLALQFGDALRRAEDFHAHRAVESDSDHGEAVPDFAGDRLSS